MRKLIFMFSVLVTLSVRADIFKEFPYLKDRLVLSAAISKQVDNEIVNNPHLRGKTLIGSDVEHIGSNEFYVYLTYRDQKIKQLPPCTIRAKVRALPTETGVRLEANDVKVVCAM